MGSLTNEEYTLSRIVYNPLPILGEVDVYRTFRTIGFSRTKSLVFTTASRIFTYCAFVQTYKIFESVYR